MRFGERLTLHVTCEPAARAVEVPTLLLQPLVENAILHGIQPSLRGGTVKITARRSAESLEVEVRDDGVGLAADAVERVGLGNCRERLTTYCGDEHALTVERGTPTGTAVRLRLPWSTVPQDRVGHVVVG